MAGLRRTEGFGEMEKSGRFGQWDYAVFAIIIFLVGAIIGALIGWHLGRKNALAGLEGIPKSASIITPQTAPNTDRSLLPEPGRTRSLGEPTRRPEPDDED